MLSRTCIGYLSGSGSRGEVAVEMQRVGDKYFSNLKKDAYIMYVCMLSSKGEVNFLEFQ